MFLRFWASLSIALVQAIILIQGSVLTALAQEDASTTLVLNPQNDVQNVINLQSPVPDQGSRGTCTVFATLGILEAVLKKDFNVNRKLSEQYLQYLVSTQIPKDTEFKTLPNSTVDGSNIQKNLRALKKWGALDASDWSYNKENWMAAELSPNEAWERSKTCDWLTTIEDRKSCYIGQFSPNQNPFLEWSLPNITPLHLNEITYAPVKDEAEAKMLLLANYPIYLSIQFFYGAWNYPVMKSLGLGEMNLDFFTKGQVLNPTAEDVAASKPYGTYHSVIVVGYNDLARVYYFKNSWGTKYWGKDTVIPGFGSAPGYGSIPYDYVRQYGSFYFIGVEK